MLNQRVRRALFQVHEDPKLPLQLLTIGQLYRFQNRYSTLISIHLNYLDFRAVGRLMQLILVHYYVTTLFLRVTAT